MPSLVRLYDFTAGTTIQSSQVDDELNAIITAINLLPDKDGTVQTNLNADMVDGFHADAAGGDQNIPVCDVAVVLQVDLNADMLDGYHATDLIAAAFDVGTKMVFYQAAPPGGWTIESAPADHVFAWKSGATGGTTAANTWSLTGFTTTVNNHALSIAEMAIHNHQISHNHDLSAHTHTLADHDHPLNVVFFMSFVDCVAGAGESVLGKTGSSVYDVDTNTSNPPGGPPSVDLTDTFTGNSSNKGSGTGHNHTASTSHGGSWRPPSAYFIVASKD